MARPLRDGKPKSEVQLDPCSENAINAFFSLFSRIEYRSSGLTMHVFQNPLAAAAYYVSIIQMFSQPLDRIYNALKKLYPGNELNKNNFRLGKEELLNYGYIAQVYFMDDDEVHYETFLPVNPILVWNMKESLIRVDATSDIKVLQKLYKNNFGPYGLKAEKGSITAFYKSRWLYYTIINNIENNKEMYMMLGNLTSFQLPYLHYYANMFKTGLKIKAILGFENKEIKQRALKLQEDFPNNIEFRFSPITSNTTRFLVSDIMAIDARKIFGKNNQGYIGTIYLDEDQIYNFKNNFATNWDNSRV